MPKNAKQALAALLIMCLALYMPASGLCAVHSSVPLPFAGSGTDDEPFLISTAAELRALSSRVNSGDGCEGEYFLLTADIDLGGERFVPIGSGAAENVFRGSFSGGGHSITGLYAEAWLGVSGAGLFGRTAGGSISALSVSGSVLGNESSACTGGIVGTASGTVFENVAFSGTVAGGLSTGGLIGAAEQVSIVGCTVSASVTGLNYTGGVVGIADSAELSGCAFSGTVSSSERAGGMLGFCYNCTAENCTNTGRITAGDRLGGIAGMAQTSVFSGCTNLGPIEGERYAGGICGNCCGTSIADSANFASVAGEDYIGGILGWSDDGADFGENGLINELTRCMNSGEWAAGGLIGDAHDARVFDCFTCGLVYSDDYAGGLIGYCAECTVSRCYNAGPVASPGSIGALTAYVSNGSAVFSDCVYLISCCAAGDPHGTSHTESELMTASAYPGFDFETVWTLGGASYPFARLQSLAAPRGSGDIDLDGGVTVSDAVTALRFAMGLASPTVIERFLADTDSSGSVTVSDALTILRAAMGIQLTARYPEIRFLK